MQRFHTQTPAFLLGMLLIVLAPVPLGAQEPVGFNHDIRPVLSENCFPCHGPDAHARKANLRLDQPDQAERVLNPGDIDGSKLVARIMASDPEDRMPPPGSRKKLSGQQKGLLTRWIGEGAAYQPHWAFIPPERPELPSVGQSSWPRNGIDYFVLRRIEEEGLTPSLRADRAVLLRRVTLDLTGLPPTPGEIAEFENDRSPDAYEKVVDRLLASPRYGEQMALDWLEAARYADTDGYQNDRFRYMHHWRDWVIWALNENLPFDEFVVEQLAGDMLPNATLRQQVATGFNRNHRINSEAGSIPEEWQVENVVDRVDTFGTVFLGLTMGCARCHDHKFDPITQKEYYRLFANFNNVPEWGTGPNNGNSPPYIEVPKSWPNLTEADNHLIRPEPYYLSMVQGAVLRPNPGDESTAMVMQEMDVPRYTHVLRRGVYNDPDLSETLAPGVPSILLGEDGTQPSNRLELAQWLVNPRHPLTARVAVNRYWQHFFGTGLVATTENFGVQGEFPSHPELLDWLATEFIRLDWDVKALHKLIVTSAVYMQSADVGGDSPERSGTAPASRPAARFAREDSAGVVGDGTAPVRFAHEDSPGVGDPDNQLLARGPRVRLTGQELRDQALFVSGLLVEKVGGPSVKPYMPPGLWESISNAKYDQGTGEDLYRRSLPKGIAVQCRETDQASAALVRDLKARGLLEDTLVVWGGEFGRTNYSQGELTPDNYGRDHHPRCFTVWMAGGGAKAGLSFGETDEFGYNVVKDGVHVHDFHATLLHLLGLDHERLTYKFQGRRFRLTDVYGSVVGPVLA